MDTRHRAVKYQSHHTSGFRPSLRRRRPMRRFRNVWAIYIASSWPGLVGDEPEIAMVEAKLGARDDEERIGPAHAMFSKVQPRDTARFWRIKVVLN